MHNSQARDGTTYAQKLQSLTRLRNKLKEWPSPPILVHVAESLTSDNIIEIDIAETILSRDEGAINAPQAHKRDDDNCYWFATLFNKNDVEYRKTEIIPGIKAACRGAGFKVNCHYNSKKNYIEVNCFRHKYHQEEKNKARNEKKQGGMKKATQQKEKKKKSEKPVNGMEDNDELCPVHFRVYWDEGRNRWFLPKVQVGVKVHCGHKHKDPSDIRLEMKDTISPTDMQIARDAFDSHINISLPLLHDAKL